MKEADKKKLYVKPKRLPVVENPFIKDAATEIEIKGKHLAVAGRGDFVDKRTGESVGDMAYLGIKKNVDAATFIKIYQAGIDLLFSGEISSRALKVLSVFFQSYREDANSYKRDKGDKLYMSFNIAQKDYLYPHTSKTFTSGKNELINFDIIAPSVEPNWYFINPAFIFKGDRLTLVHQYFTGEAKQDIPKAISENTKKIEKTSETKDKNTPDIFDGKTEAEREAEQNHTSVVDDVSTFLAG